MPPLQIRFSLFNASLLNNGIVLPRTALKIFGERNKTTILPSQGRRHYWGIFSNSLSSTSAIFNYEVVSNKLNPVFLCRHGPEKLHRSYRSLKAPCDTTIFGYFEQFFWANLRQWRYRAKIYSKTYSPRMIKECSIETSFYTRSGFYKN